MGRLTKREIEALKVPPGKSHVLVWDDDPRGFGVRVNRGGSKVFFVYYRTLEKRQRFVTIAPYGVMSLDQARARAKEILVRVAQGEDPGREKRERVNGKTMKDLMAAHIEYAEAKNKPTTFKEYRRQWEKVIIPSKLGRLTVREVTQGDIEELHTKMKDTPYLANAVLRLLSKAFSLAEKWGWRDRYTNPCKGIEKYDEEERVATLEPEELYQLGQAIDNHPNPRIGLALRLYLATGCRRSEILQAKFEDVDYHRGILFLHNTKGGGKDVEAVSLPPSVIEEICELDKDREGNPYIIPGRKKGQPLVNIYKPWVKIRTEANLPWLRIHDLRHVFATIAHDMGHSRQKVAKMLRHKQLSTTERYMHVTDKSRHQAAIETAKLIEHSMKTKAPQEEPCEA